MALRYSFSRIWKIAVAVICLTLFVMSAVGFVFAQQMHHKFEYEMASQVKLLNLATDMVYEVSEISAAFGKLLVYHTQTTNVSTCILHLDRIRQKLDDPLFAEAGQAELCNVIRESELQLRTMLYAYQATNFSDPARDMAHTSLERIITTIRDARQAALTQCRRVQSNIEAQTRGLAKTVEWASICLYIALTAGLVSILSMVFIIGRELKKRLHYIIFATDQVRKGDLAYRIHMPFDDEISEVASRFNSMAEEIEKKDAQLGNSNRILANALDEAHHASQMKDEFLTNISHEIRTPMNAIIGFTNMVLEDGISEEQRQYLTMVLEASTNLMEIIEDILDFSRIESGRMEIEKQDCLLRDITQYIESLAMPLAQKKNLQFGTYLCQGLPSVIHADPLRLQQCLINLVNNAIKFTSEGHVYLNISLETGGHSQWLRFDVEDTGIGIPADKRDLIFEPFRQVDGSACREYGGTGLGLSITRKLAELMGGSVSVQSTVDVGSVFTLLLPVFSENMTSREQACEEKSGTGETT